MKGFPPPLKFSIPAILLLMGGSFSSISFRYEVSHSAQRIEQNTQRELAFSGSQTAGLLENLYRDLEGEGIDTVIDHLGAAPNIKLVILTNGNGRVLKSTQYQLVGQAVTETPFARFSEQIQAAKTLKTGQTLLSADRNSLTAVYPVGLAFSPGKVSPDKVGALLIESDLAVPKAEGIQEAQQRSIAAISLYGLMASILWIFFHQTVTRRVDQLVNTSNRLAEGDLGIRANLSGCDELAEVSQAFDQMAEKIQDNIETIQRTQSQLIQSEKMSSLGQLVAGIAHEINNPVNFISGNVDFIKQYTQALLELIDLYQAKYPEANLEIQDLVHEIDLEFLRRDLPEVLASMKTGTERIQQIVLSLRNFSRLDESSVKTVDLHEGLDNALMILTSRLKLKSSREAIVVIKDYAELPKIQCYAGQINQVFMNILVNAIDTLDAQAQNASRSIEQVENNHETPTIRICTEAVGTNRVSIKIADNGEGIAQATQSRIFDPFFTTKPVGQGTGLGLSVGFQIVVDQHQGELRCLSEAGKGTEFQIELPVELA